MGKTPQQIAEERLDAMLAQLQAEPLYAPSSPEWEVQGDMCERMRQAAYRELLAFAPPHIQTKIGKIASHAAYLTLHEDEYKTV